MRAAAGNGLPALALGAGLALVLAANGGYFPTSWGWSGTGLAWAAALAAVLTDFDRPSRLELLFVGGLASFAGWIALSLAWTSTQSETGAELERMLVYVAGALAVVTIVGAQHAVRLLAGVLAGTWLICLYALTTRLFPHQTQADAFAGSRLSTPIGYWNGLGIVAAMSMLLALVFVARAESRIWRGVATGAMPVLAATLYFTYSRGAWLSLIVAAAVLFAVSRTRLQLLGASIPALLGSAFVVWRASQQSALTHTDNASLQAAVHQGRSLVFVVAGACIVAGYAGWANSRLDQLWERPAVVGASRWVLGGVALVVVVAVIVQFGSPVTIVHRGYRSFVGSTTSGTDLNSRLFTFANNGRLPAWRVAWHEFEHHPVGGIGAGGFENAWYQHRTITDKVRDAHNFYLETLAEGGLVGAFLLIGTLLIPFGAFRRVQSSPFAAGALAAYLAYFVHAIVDWDWEITGVTLVALFCGMSLLVLGRSERPVGKLRWPVLGVASLVGLVALSGLVAQLALNASSSATKVNDTSRALSDARLAHRLMPWSAEPWEALGAAQLGSHQRAAAVASYTRAVQKSPGDYRLWIALAKAESGQPRWTDFAVALKLNPLGADQTRLIAQQLLNPNPGATP